MLKTERGDEPSESRSGYGWEERRETTQKKKSLSVEVYLQITADLTLENKNNNNNKKTGEAENVLSPSLHGGVCVCEGSLKLYFTAKMIFSERWPPVGISEGFGSTAGGGLTIVHFHLIQTANVVNKHGLKRSAARPFPPTARSLSNKTFPPALPNVGVSVSWQARGVPF